MTTTLINPAKVATVNVVHGDDKITVKSVKATLTIDFTVLGVEYTREERDLFVRIERGPSPRPMELTYADLAAFKAAHDRVKAMEDVGTLPIASVDRPEACKPSNAETVTPILPTVVQPETTVTIAPIVGPAPVHMVAPKPSQTVQASVDGLASPLINRIASVAIPDTYKGASEADEAERSIRMLEEALRILTENGLVTISYDVPDRFKAQVGNLRRKFMRLGFLPVQKSVLIGVDKITRTTEFRAIVDMLVKYHVTFQSLPLHDTIAAMVRESAKEKLRAQIVSWHRSLVLNIASASDRIAEVKAAVLADESKGTAELEASETKEHNSMRATIKEACESLEIAIQLAELYDDSQDTKALIDGLRAAIRSQAQTFNAMARMRRIKLAPMPS